MADTRSSALVCLVAVLHLAVVTGCARPFVGAPSALDLGTPSARHSVGAAGAVTAAPDPRPSRPAQVLPSAPLPSQGSTVGPVAGPVPEPSRAPLPVGPTATPPSATGVQHDFRVGDEDELEISVFDNPELAKKQIVRPDGKIVFPLIGEVQAAGQTPYELSEQITQRIAKFVKNPRVTVIVTQYNSRKVSVLGQVRTPGLLRLSVDVNLLEAVSRSGGLTEDADLLGALLIRDGQSVPVNFERLFRQGDFGHNVLLRPKDVVLIPSVRDRKAFVLGEIAKPQVLSLKPDVTLVEAISSAGGVTAEADLQGAMMVRRGQIQPVSFEKLLKGDLSFNLPLEPNDVILVPSLRDRKVFVLGEVNRPLAMGLRPGVTVVESISTAGGFTRDAQSRTVLVVRGGLGDPKLLTVNVNEIMKKGDAAHNLVLEPGDIVYVPKTMIANVVRFFQDVSSILTPFVLAETGIVLGPSMQAVLTGRGTVVQTTVTTPLGR